MKLNGSCHCGNVKFEAEGSLEGAITCNCSMCSRKGTILVFVPAENFKLLSGRESLTDYQFGQKHIHHNFCSTCGVTSFAHGTSPEGVEMYAVNLRCVEQVDLETLKTTPVDGRSL